MKKYFQNFLGLGALLVSFTAAAAQLGDPAAPLDIAAWVKGDAVNLADVKGKQIVVVEFWATWCGPCKASIPHLTELQQKFAERGVTFIGVSDEDVAKVRAFVDQMGAKMNYTVAVDNNRQTSKGYMAAFNAKGIPHAFIVDREGRIAWEGHPMGDLEKELEKLATATVAADPKELRRAEAQRKLREFTEMIARGDDAAKLDALAADITALEKELGSIEAGRKLDLPELRRTVRFQSLMRDYQRAVAAGKSAAELADLEKAAAPLAPAGFKFADYRGNFGLQRAFQEYYRAVTGKGDAAQIELLTHKLELVESTDVAAQTEIAWTLLTDENIKTRDAKLALKFAQAAYTASDKQNVDVIDTCARALFANGQVGEAVKLLRSAMEAISDAAKKAALQKSLAQYAVPVK